MRIEKINENKIRIFLNLNDLREKNIDIHSFMSNPIESQSLFLDILSYAEEKIGFVTKDYRISIEALAMEYGDFILTITRNKDGISKDKKQFKIKRKFKSLNQNTSIHSFENFDEFIEFCNCFTSSSFFALSKKLKSSKLYELNSTYYFVFESYKLDLFNFKKISSILSEFSKPVYESDLFIHKLQEYGNLIIKTNPIGIINKNFLQSKK